ncbi:MAG: heterodisulfide reductase-related iron-sulfur binding cluster [Candidatus Methanomethyliaceae archaeon]|nr:heterodisulfide reductase-related iron-sulfur binding cluster [Candidatus Methanomethyliaceae archaeon]
MPILYWKGCMARFRTKKIANSIEELFSRMELDYIKLSNEGCCGSILYRTGQDAMEVSKQTMEKIRSVDVREVVTGCPGCFRTMSKDYESFEVKIYNISQFLLKFKDLLRENLREINVKVTYHDPCHLGRHMGIYEEPRQLIKLIPGIELVEFKHNRERALCCGYGGGLRSAYPEVSMEIAKSLLNEVPNDVEILITACPFCNYALNNSRIKVLDLSELLLMAWRD